MDTSSKPKRGTPETDVEPKGKAGRPKIKYVDLRPEAEKREGDDMPEETNRKKSKRINKNKEKKQRRLEAKMTKKLKYKKAIDELYKGNMSDDKFEDNKIKKTLANVAFGLLEKSFNRKTVSTVECLMALRRHCIIKKSMVVKFTQ